jgi:HlyD family secretion protein
MMLVAVSEIMPNVSQIGHRNNEVAEVMSGLSPGDRVVLHPSDRVKNVTATRARDPCDM